MRYDADVTNLYSGQFDLSFDASAVNVTGVNYRKHRIKYSTTGVLDIYRF